MPAHEPDPPSRAANSAAVPSAGPPEEEFIRAVSQRRPATQPDIDTAKPGIDTTVDEVSLPPAAGMLALDDPPGPTKRGAEIVADGKELMDTDELVGTTLSQTYEIVRVVGEGGMGRVYEARHTRIASKRFAIKTLHPEYLRQPDVLARFQREAEAAAAIESPHVVGVVDVDRTRDGRPFLVTDFLDGEDLGNRLKTTGRLPVPGAARVVRQVCKALTAAHARGIVHRDIKPDNVFLTGPATAPVAKVLDFGISRIASASGNSLTKTGMIMGTPAYMAPEQARGTRVDHRADIYSLGAVLYTAVTGKEPFDVEDPSAVLAAVLTRDPPRPRSIEPSIDEHLELIIQKAMAKEPEDRYQDVGELYAALAPYDPEETLEQASSPTAATDVWPERSHIRSVVGGGARAGGRKSTQAKFARPRVALTAAIGLLWIITLFVVTVGGVVRLVRDGGTLSHTETMLVLLVVGTTLVTPLVLAIRHVTRNVWDNTAKVMALGTAIREPLVASVVVYGLLALTLRGLESLVMHRAAALGWAVWDLLLVAFAVTAAASVALLRRAESRAAGSSTAAAQRRQQLLPAALVAGGALLAGFTVYLAVSLRDAAEPSVPQASAMPGGDGSSVSTGTVHVAPAAKASTADLEAAKREGVDALRALRKAHPQDPAVLQALMLAEGKQPDGLAKAIDLAEELFRMAPTAAQDEDVYRFMFKAANATDAVADKALDLMAHQMGPRGPDLLYELWTGGGTNASQAEKLLADPKVRKRGTPALRIAVDMRKAKGCKAKGALLDRAAKEGDERVVVIIKPLSKGTRRGCGFLDLSPCPARCSAQAAEMKRTIAAIQARAK